ncbi:mechanosensitive ion channel family protein [Spongiibacter nanhainus]|uniref:Small-conductance mechanosensitive channel n=1 Tax=Spongiibacter nanhainus TaxID=2794344 RepID=A0A7T4QY27_9GAMM|nr:mechanosensitive ion channel family protein [Spongiibacter nanhainus]QQD16757.1 mechanosensitive ion channel family protein [Spongiibacter nanhainus]
MFWKVVIAVLALVGIVSLSRFLNRLLREFGAARQVNPRRLYTVSKGINILMWIVAFLVMCFILGLSYDRVFIFMSSVLAVIGVALFAQWSILSHLTAGMIIFFAFPYRVGDRVKVVDPDADVIGEIIEIASFHVLIRLDDGATITYPNSALLQRAVIKQPSNRAEAAPVEQQAVTTE